MKSITFETIIECALRRVSPDDTAAIRALRGITVAHFADGAHHWRASEAPRGALILSCGDTHVVPIDAFERLGYTMQYDDAVTFCVDCGGCMPHEYDIPERAMCVDGDWYCISCIDWQDWTREAARPNDANTPLCEPPLSALGWVPMVIIPDGSTPSVVRYCIDYLDGKHYIPLRVNGAAVLWCDGADPGAVACVGRPTTETTRDALVAAREENQRRFASQNACAVRPRD